MLIPPEQSVPPIATPGPFTESGTELLTTVSRTRLLAAKPVLFGGDRVVSRLLLEEVIDATLESPAPK